MSGWPWMKGESVAIADPKTTTDNNNDDDRPIVKELINKHRMKIDELKEKLASCDQNHLYDTKKHDDLWILRFLISHKFKVSKAFKAAKSTLEFRHKHKLDELGDIRHVHIGHDFHALNKAAQNYQKCCDETTFRFVVHDRCVVSYIQWSGFNQPKLLAEVPPQDWLPGFAYITEWSHQWVDYLTRTTGRLTKTIRIVDLADITLSKNCVPKSAFRDAKALNAMEDVYPQLLQGLFLVKAPIWIEGPWKTIRPLVPKRVLEKFDFLEPTTKPHHKAILLKWIDDSKLPTRYGGQFKHWPDDTPPPSTSSSSIAAVKGNSSSSPGEGSAETELETEVET